MQHARARGTGIFGGFFSFFSLEFKVFLSRPGHMHGHMYSHVAVLRVRAGVGRKGKAEAEDRRREGKGHAMTENCDAPRDGFGMLQLRSCAVMRSDALCQCHSVRGWLGRWGGKVQCF